jgi:O-antigen ligase
MVRLSLALLILWSLFPALAVNIGPVPPFMLLCVLLVLAAILQFRNTFNSRGWQLYAFFGAALLVSQLAAVRVEDTLQRTIGTATIWVSVPFIGIWLRSRRHRDFMVCLIGVLLLLTDVYVLVFGGEFLATGTRFGPLQFTLNGTGFSLAISATILLPKIEDRRLPSWLRWSAIGIVALSFYVVLFHLGSRTALITMVVGCVVHSCWSLAQPKRLGGQLTGAGKRLRMLIPLMLIVSLGVTYGAYTNSTLPPFIQLRAEKLLNPTSDSSPMVRLSFAKKAWLMFWDHPLTGGGWDNFRFYQYGQEAPVTNRGSTRYVSSDTSWPHSSYVKILGETGSLGTIAFALILWSIMRGLLHSLRLERRGKITPDESAWIWVPVFLVFTLTHDTIDYYSAMLFAMLHGKLLEGSWAPVPVRRTKQETIRLDQRQQHSPRSLSGVSSRQ